MAGPGTSTSAVATRIGANELVCIASDGTACVIWFDGTNQKFSYASSPYTSWTTATLTAGTQFAASAFIRANDNIDVVTGLSPAGTEYYLLTKSGTSYSVGSGVAVSSTNPTAIAGEAMSLSVDAQGRYWALSNTNAATIMRALYSAANSPQTATWTSSLATAITSFADNPVGDMVGNYLVGVAYMNAVTTFQYQRADVHSATIGAWSTLANCGTMGGGTDNTKMIAFRGNGSGVGILAYSSYSGIYAQSYTAATDTWSAATQLSTSANDTNPTLTADASGNVYCFWSSYAAANNYALVYKKWMAGTWDTSATTLVASGTNIQNPNVGCGNNTIGVLYTTGTASPWTVNFATVTPGVPAKEDAVSRFGQLDTNSMDAGARFGLKQAGGDPPLTIFGLHAASTTLPTAAITGTATGGVSSSFTTLIGTSTGYGELWGLGNAGAWAAGGSLPAPDGHGWILDATTLEGQLLQAGTFTMTHRLATSAAYTTFTATLYGRAYKYNGGTYTQIGPTMSVAANLTTTTTTYTLSATMPNTYFGIGDKLYFDTFLQITASTGGSGTTTVRVSNSSNATFGVANQAQLMTAGYLPGRAKDALARFRLVKTRDALTRFRQLAPKSVNALSRFRLLGAKSVDVVGRYRQQSGTTYHHAQARFRLVKALDTLMRFRQLATTSKDLSHRFRLTSSSALTMAWIYPGSPACNAPFEYADGRRIDVLKPQYYALQSDGTLIQNTVALAGCNGYSAANVTDIKKYSTQQFVTISGQTAGMDALATNSTKTTNFINTITAFLSANGLTGVELDFEGFGLSAMSATQYADYKTLVTTVGNALHGSGFRLMITGPAIFNSTYQGFYRWHWEDFDTLPVDYLVVLCYDFQFDNGAGTAVAPLSTITSTCTWMQNKITDPNRIVIGLNSYGYHGTTGAFSGLTLDTQVQSQSLPGFGTATRDVGSGEMMWANGGVSYDYSDITTLDGKRAAVYATGLRNISVWHLGGNQWFSNVMATIASRFRQQSGTTSHGLQSRFRQLAPKSVNALSRFRLLGAKSVDVVGRYRQLAPRSMDVVSRLRQQSGTTYHHVLARFRQLVTRSVDAMARYRQQSGLINRDLQARYRQIALKSLDATSRYRQLALKSVDAINRYRQQSVTTYHHVLTRYRQLATKSVDAVSRLRQQSGTTYHHALTRYRLVKAADVVARFVLQPTIVTYIPRVFGGTIVRVSSVSRDALARFMLQSALQKKDSPSRFRQLVTKSLDVVGRYRQLVTKSVDVVSRLRLQSGTTYHHAQARFRQLVAKSVDAVSRFRQQSGILNHDLQARFRQLAAMSRDAVSRLRLQSALQKKDLPSRLRLLAPGSVDAISRFRQQSGTTYHHALTRFQLVKAADVVARFQLVKSVDALARFRQLAAKSIDLSFRYRQLATKSVDIISRFRQLTPKSVDAMLRFRQQSGILPHNSVSRFRVQSGTQSKDSQFRFRPIASIPLSSVMRFRQLVTRSVDVVSRFLLQSSGQLKDMTTRYRQQSGTTYRDALARFQLVKSVDALARFRLVKALDTVSRFRQLVTTSKDAVSRLRLLVTRRVDSMSRFRLGKALDTPGRFRLVKSLDALARFMQQSGVLTHDLQARYRQIAAKSVDAMTRYRQLATQSLDSISRFSQQSGTTYHDILTRFRQLATTSVDSISRFMQQSGVLPHDLQARFRQLAAKSVDAMTRYRQLATQSLDSISRFRLIGSPMKDVIGRYRLQSALQKKDSPSRFRQLVTTSVDSLSRFRQQSLSQSKDTVGRFRQLVTTSLDVIQRFRLVGSPVKDVIGRFRLAVAADALTRFGLQSVIVTYIPRIFGGTIKRVSAIAMTSRDALARFMLQSVLQKKDAGSRFRVQSGTTYHDIGLRYRLQVVTQVTLSTIARFRQLATRNLDIVSRFRVQSAQQFKDSLSRYRLLATNNADQSARFRLQLFVTNNADQSARFRLQSALQKKDSPSRFRQLATRSVDVIARFMLQSRSVLKDVRIRLPLLAGTSVSVIARLRVKSALIARDALSRFRLQSVTPFKDALARYRLLASKSVSVVGRFRFLGVSAQSVVGRLRQQSGTLNHDSQIRFRQQSGTVSRETLSRFRLQVVTPLVLDALARLRLLATRNLDTQTRFRLILGIQGKDAQARFLLTPQTLSSAGSLLIILTFRDGLAKTGFRDGADELTFRDGADELAFRDGADELTFDDGVVEDTFH